MKSGLDSFTSKVSFFLPNSFMKFNFPVEDISENLSGFLYTESIDFYKNLEEQKAILYN